jgi:hypothetical protein
VYAQRDPGLLIRLRGQPPISGTIYELEKLRCHLCGEVFTADPPAGVGPEKYDPTTGAMIALLKYGSGMPFHRLERLQADLQIPLPASTQWDIVDDLATRIRPILSEVIRQAANGEVVHNDDTSMTVLALGRPGAPRGDPDDVSPDRPGRLHVGHRRDARWPSGRPLCDGPPSCRREPRPGPRGAVGRSRPPDSDV